MCSELLLDLDNPHHYNDNITRHGIYVCTKTNGVRSRICHHLMQQLSVQSQFAQRLACATLFRKSQGSNLNDIESTTNQRKIR